MFLFSCKNAVTQLGFAPCRRAPSCPAGMLPAGHGPGAAVVAPTGVNAVRSQKIPLSALCLAALLSVILHEKRWPQPSRY